ncbi:FxsA family protein [Myxococcus sp. K15C18031901]|uniref:FxsA family protein n=1 Tax=Myxococcus dinghuensis TaxID=2906761 RepID=UPI0020A71447|nr:FxsA family protein [Myxococcus dinghuensis]MCP3098942.1 FxsA family protein [Myxococcus dinghuensis]
MFKYLLLAFIVVPLLELYLLVVLGRHIGFAPTLGVVLFSALLGSWLARREGSRVTRRWREAMARGQVPEEGLFSGALVLAGGVLFVVPGVLTDVAGLLLLFPPTRRLVAGRLRRAAERRMRDGSLRVTTFGGMGGGMGFPPMGPSEDAPFARRSAPEFPTDVEAREEEVPRGPRRSPTAEVDAEFTEEDPPRH